MRPPSKPIAVVEQPPSSAMKRARRAFDKTLTRSLNDDRGATAIEYTAIAALIAMAIIVFVSQIGGFVQTAFQTVASSI